MSLERVKDYFKKYGIENKIIELESSSATVKEAASSIGCLEGEIAKTLSFQLSDRIILIVMAGDSKLDNHKYKEYFHEKSKMVDVSLVEELVGHQVGGVCPFGINDNVEVYLDISLKKYKTVYPACGNDHSAIPLTIEELEKYSNCKEWVDVGKSIEENSILC